MTWRVNISHGALTNDIARYYITWRITISHGVLLYHMARYCITRHVIVSHDTLLSHMTHCHRMPRCHHIPLCHNVPRCVVICHVYRLSRCLIGFVLLSYVVLCYHTSRYRYHVTLSLCPFIVSVIITYVEKGLLPSNSARYTKSVELLYENGKMKTRRFLLLRVFNGKCYYYY